LACDLLGADRVQLLQHMDSQAQVVFDWSNIWTTYPCFVYRSLPELTASYQEFVRQIALRNPYARIFGHSPNWHLFNLEKVENVAAC
jgi:hypothetical protein